VKMWLKRIGLGLLTLLVLIVAGGAVFEQWARYRAPFDFPPPGKMVDIGGRRIQIDCRGSGSPTVVFESGGDWSGAAHWRKVQDEVAHTTRACSYSRAGILWSDPARDARNSDAILADLHSLLEKAGEKPPLVLVGWSLGGPYAVLYTQHYGSDVAGLVLIDPSHPDQWLRFDAITHHRAQPFTPLLRVAPKLTWSGILRLWPSDGPSFAERAEVAFMPTSLPSVIKELNSLDDTLAAEGAAHDLGARPLVVLTSMAAHSPLELQAFGATRADGKRLKQAWKGMHDEMAAWSSAGRNEIVRDSGHEIALQRPQVVIRAINEVVAAVRGNIAAQKR
jgi:pimeloyl-ACP methyl ester carboxylesterase